MLDFFTVPTVTFQMLYSQCPIIQRGILGPPQSGDGHPVNEIPDLSTNRGRPRSRLLFSTAEPRIFGSVHIDLRDQIAPNLVFPCEGKQGFFDAHPQTLPKFAGGVA